jgi:signal transduction histidine kinase/ActR/RegA family two-component response regulator
MIKADILENRCILTQELPDDQDALPFIARPQARCAGTPPANPLKLYPLCCDCNLLHALDNRELFSRLSFFMTESFESILERKASFELGCAAMRKMLERLALGDPDARVVLPDDFAPLRDLEPLLNGMADVVKAQVDESHEIAIGLCEHYETLLKLANGDLSSRAATTSPIELIAKLGELINNQVGAFLDVLDEQKKVEEERELFKDQLHHAQKLDSIGQLAGGIAHEFNNILATILGYAGILEIRLGKDSPHLSALRHIIGASEKGASLTRGMLAFSRNQAVKLEPLGLNGFVGGLKEMLTRLAGENIRIEFNTGPQELLLNADQGQLRQIIINLYNNARDAMQDGGSLTIATAGRTVVGNETDVPAGLSPGNYALLTVADTGHGIPPEVMERIFDPFFTTKEVGKGTGLGLSIVFGIVQQHGGGVAVTSTPGKGTLCSVWLPEFSAVAPVSASTEAGQGGAERGGETILVGEDNVDVRPMIVELLRDFGYHVLEASDGAEVVALMKEFGSKVDLLLLDVIMPGVNGFEALSIVRESHPGLPCLFLSGYSDDIVRQKAKISGEFEYLSKPIMPEKLLEAVRATLDCRPSA